MMRSLMKSLFILSCLCLGLTACNQGDLHPQTLKLNREGNELFKTQNPQGASEKYIEGLRFNPFQPELHLNLGLAFEYMQQPEKALQSYKKADELAIQEKNGFVAFAARYNAAQLLGKAKKVDEALELYQKALDLVPTSKETKHNIELLTQQQQGQGGGEGQDQKDPQDGDKNQQQKPQDGKDQDKKEQDKDQDGKEQKEEKPKEMKQSQKYKPRPFKGEELSEGDVKKILGEIKQQEQRIRADFNRKETKEQPRDKDW
ncbi:Tetratricopeptide repeat protein [compost metagenome]